RLFPAPGETAAPRAAIDWRKVHEEMKRRSVTLVLLWQEYRAEQTDGYGYSRFCDLYGEWRKTISATMRQTHPAGEKLFVDYAGDTVPVFDQTNSTERPAHIFVAAPGASNYTYAEARWSEGLGDWIGAHVNALATIGGVPKAVVCDNLKAGSPGRHARAGHQPQLSGARGALRFCGAAGSRAQAARQDDCFILHLIPLTERY